MVRSALSKVAWVGRTASMVFGLALVLALVFGVASMAFGANGQSFLLGRFNAATALTKLTGNVNGAAMQVQNTNAGANDTALSLAVQSGEAPMSVNSKTRVANLNAATAGRADSAARADNAANAQNAAGLECTGCVSASDLGADAATQAELDSEANTRTNADNALSTQLAGKADTNHSHDDRYYTETEMNTALSGKANTTHQHSTAVTTFSGLINVIGAGNSNYVFAGPTATVTVGANQRLTGSAAGAMALPSGSAAQAEDIGLCYQSTAPGSAINNFFGQYITTSVTDKLTLYPAAASVLPSAGTYNVGLCVRNSGPAQISNNDYVNGWVMVTNN